MSRISVYLLDDHELVRTGLRQLLGAEPDIDVVGESGSAVVATRRIPALRPDVAVLDARLPDGSGIEVCRAVRAQDPSIRILVLTTFDEDESLFAAILAGASGYVLKSVRNADLVDDIRTVAAGGSLIDPALTGRVLDRVRQGPSEEAGLEGLTAQERRVLALIAQGLSNRQIAEQTCLAEKTVKNYVSSILSKLGMQRRTQAAVLMATIARPRQSADGPVAATHVPAPAAAVPDPRLDARPAEPQPVP